MVREELGRLLTWSERHRRLVSRILVTFVLTLLIDLAGAIIVWQYESGIKGSDVHGFGDALFFSTVQILTVSSQLRNPVTTAGRTIDVGLEIWAVFVVTAIAGSFATFFLSGDSADSG